MVSYVEASTAPVKNDGQIKLHGPEAFAAMRRAGRLAAECLDAIEDIVRPGLTTEAIDRFVYDFARDRGALPATLGYKGYMKSTCVSLNHVVCHGIPGDKPLRDGDIANIDVTLIVDGWHGELEPYVPRRRRQARRRAPLRRDPRGDDARHRRGQARRHDR